MSGTGTELAEDLVLRGISKSFNGVPALREVDLTVHPGEVHALMGENGSGKSTLIKVLAGFHVADAGTARMGDVDLDLGDAAQVGDTGVRFVHQELALVESMSSVENFGLYTGFSMRGGRIDWRAERSRTQAAVAGLGYDFDVDALVSELTAAERTVVAIARALEGDESIKVLVLDEPTASLSGSEAERLFEVVARIRERGVGVLLVSHHLDEVLAIADRFTVLRDGVLVASLARDEVQRPELVRLMTGVDVEPVRAQVRDLPSGASVLEARALGGGALSGIDLEVRAGEILAVAGLTGSGREELARILVGIDECDTGSFAIAGEQVTGLGSERLRELGVGYVPGDRFRYGLFPNFTVAENLSIGDLRPTMRNGLIRSGTERSEATELIARHGIRPSDPSLNIMALSGGNAQKVLLARVMRTSPRLLVLDDPTRGVDVAAKAEIHRLVDEAAAAGTAVVVCSSDSEELVRLGHRVVVLRRGVIVAEQPGGSLSPDALTRLTL